ETKYGVVTAQLQNVIVVGTPKEDHYDTPLQMSEKIQNDDLPVSKGEPIHTLINKEEHFKQYIADNNFTIDLDQPLEDLRESAEIFFNIPEWQPGIPVEEGDQLRWNNILYDVVHGHTTQSNWEPQDTPAMFTVATPIGLIADWKAPTGAHDAYNTGDKVRHDNEIWTSTINDNVWEPGVYGWATE
ncbi:MAG: carbohydrate-binding protein, partial [Bacteroidota bacterium]